GSRHVWRSREALIQWYPVLFEVGLCLSLLTLIGVLHIDIRVTQAFEINDVAPVVVNLEDIAQTAHIEKPPPPPRPAPPVEVPDEAELDDEVLEIDAEIDIDAPVDLPPPPPPPQSDDEIEPEIFVIVEEMPVLIGGMERLHDLIRYPELAIKAGIEGLVVVTFVVEPDGSISNREVVRSSGELLDNAALDAVGKVRFTPGKQRGKPVRVRFSLPVRFRIKNSDDVL
ncbi:MAG TPA: energy transducer TonB, partial [Rhodothermia bacterium]|nr:energy transducer TonB [Rhodothermia bacterium]